MFPILHNRDRKCSCIPDIQRYIKDLLARVRGNLTTPTCSFYRRLGSAMARVGFALRWLVAGTPCILISILLSGVAQAQTNSWANPSHGFWDDSESWSLGVLPTNSQSVFITNAVSKTVTVDSYTATSYPESLTVSNLTVSAPGGVTNTLLLDNSGLTIPLFVLNIVDIDTNGVVVVNDSIVQVSGNLFIGQLGNNDALTIMDGGHVYSGSGSVGYPGQYGSTNNVVTVTGPAAVWSNSDDLFVGGAYTTGNSLTVSNGGAVYDATAYVSGDANSVLVIGEGSVWKNDGDLKIGYSGYGSLGNSLIIANGGAVYDNNGVMLVAGESVLVTGPGSVWSNRDDLSTSDDGGNSLTISDGGVVYSSSGHLDGDDDDLALITGTGSIWNISGDLEIGFMNSVIISDGGMLNSGGDLIGAEMQVMGNGSVVSINGSLDEQISLTVADEAAVFTGSASISSLGAVSKITGGGLYVTNGQLAVSGSLTFNGGTVTADQLLVSSSFTFTSGLLTSGGTSVTNGQSFVVGNGTNGATFQLASGGTGIHSFANGLTISSNAFLTGCGTVEGSVVDNPGGTIVANCGGTLTFTGIVTNNGTMQALNGSVLEAYALVVNNGIIDIRAGTTNFHGGFINNGIVITTNNFPVITAIQAVGPDVKVSVHTGNGSTYLFEETTNLTTGTWTPIIEFYGTGGIINFIDPGAATLPQRFYRIGLVPSP
jgi:T5SS/PEP-CTERM-associated repeat protein